MGNNYMEHNNRRNIEEPKPGLSNEKPTCEDSPSSYFLWGLNHRIESSCENWELSLRRQIQMGKRKDGYFWTRVEKRPEGVECKYCSSLFKGRPSISRMKSHLLGTPNQGISICDKIPHELRLELEEINKRYKILPSSSNVVERLRLEPQSGEQATGQCNRAFSGWTQDEQLASVHPGSQPSEARATKGIKLLTTAFEGGDALRSNLDKVWSWLMNSDIGGVGVYGMGGIGKTALAKHINNRLLRDPNPFLHVYWVGVSQHCSIKKLQSAIAGAIGMSLPSFENETLHAARLCEALVEKKKLVLILDDVWEFLDLERAGIPVGSNICKLVVTSRTLSMCRLIGCQKIIKMQTLSKQQSWSLFVATLGGGTTLPIQVEKVAKSIVKQCEGLPLGIVTVAKCMRGVVDLREWRKILEELKGSMPRQQIVELFGSLKLSYNALREPMFKQVFMFCALLQKDLESFFFLSSEQQMVANKLEVVDCLVTNGLAEGLESGQIEFDAMHHSLNLLEDAALLIFEPFMKSHGLLKVMAILITKESGDVIIEVDNEKLENLPAEGKWTSALKDVLLVGTSISCIAPNHPPKCPRLSSLYVNSRYLLSIDELFFQHLSGLKILDLSNTEIERLPYSVCMLENLTSLVVSGCTRLNYVPPLSKLQALKKLDMSYCYDVEEVPDGLELLKDLNYLNLVGTGIDMLPHGLIGSLSRLQDLKVSAYIEVEELPSLKLLETLVCRFTFRACSSAFAELTHSLLHDVKSRRLSRYSLLIGNWNNENFYDLPLSHYSALYSDFGLVYERVVKFQNTIEIDDTWAIKLPRHIQCLIIHNAHSVWKSLVLQNGLCAAGLRCLDILHCDGLEYLWRFPSSSGTLFERIEILELSSLNDLLSLFRSESAAPSSPEANMLLYPGVFCQLRKLHISSCKKIVRLFPPELLSNLQNLEKLEIFSCVAMEVIFDDEDNNNTGGSCSTGMFCLPKLKILKLINLARLQRISSKNIICGSLQKIYVADCKNLLNISFSLPIPSLKRLFVCPPEWWQSVHWENPVAKARLPYCPWLYGYETESKYDSD